MRKILSMVLAIGVLTLLAACGEEAEEISTPPSFEGITVEGRNPVTDGEQDPYRVEKNADITLEIHFSNPDNVEFNTVQINGTTYRAHRFSEDSTSRNLILDLNAGRLTGETTYAIEEIEYIDEEGVKSISVTENNAYTLFVMRSTPAAVFEDIIATQESLDVEITIEDPDGTLIGASLELIHQEDGVLQTIDLSEDTGFVTHEFIGLESDTSYDLRVIADFETDAPDTDGTRTDVNIGEMTDVTTEAKTVPTAAISGVTFDEESYAFDLAITDPDGVIVDGSLEVEVVRDGTVHTTRTLDPSSLDDIPIEGLLSGMEYTLNIYADYDLNDGEGVLSDEQLAQDVFTTEEKTLGELEATVSNITKDSLTLDIDSSALYESVDIERLDIRITDANTGAELRNHKMKDSGKIYELNDLHADQEVRIVITATYYLNAGQQTPEESPVFNETFTTQSNSAPTAEIDDVDLSQEGAEVSWTVFDPDDTIVSDSLTLYLYENGSETPVATLSGVSGGTALIEYDVLAENAYTVEVGLDYDLRDNTGVKNDVLMDSVYTAATLKNKAPTLTINSVSKDSESISVEYTIFDNDGTIISDGINLEIDGTEHTLDTLEDTFVVSDLLSDTSYDITLELSYDLNDGEGTRTLPLSRTVRTDAKTVPTLEIGDTQTTETGLEYTHTLTDPDSLAVFESVRVLKDGTEVATFNEGEDLSGLLSNTAYTMEVTYSYDLNDGEGDRTLNDSYAFTTDAYGAPSVSITDIASTQEGFSFDYAFTDSDGVIDETSLTFTYDSNEEALSSLEGSVAKTGLLSDATYTVALEAEYDLNDGQGPQTLTIEETVTTTSRTSASATSGGNTSEVGASTFDMTISDPDGTIVTGTLEAVLTNESGTVLETWNPATGEVSLTHHALIYDETLTLTLRADIDLRDGDGSVDTTLLETTLTVPEYVTYEEDTLTEDAFKGSLDLSSLADVISDFDTVESTLRYVDYDEVIGQARLSNQSLFYDVKGLLADRDVELSISATYDLGEGEKTGEVYSMIIRTEANEAPSADLDITGFDADAGTIDFTAVITDSDDVRLDNSTYAKLYRENSEGDMVLHDTMMLDDDSEDGAYTFSGLSLDYREFYLMEIETDYYLRDARGVHENANLDVDSVVIDVTPDAPESTISSVTIEAGSVTFDATVTDRHGTIENGSLYAVLYQDGSEVDRTELNSLDETLTFTDLKNAESHTIEIIADVDLKEASIREAELLDSHAFTSYDSSPTVTTSVDTDKGEATIDYTIVDADATIDMATLDAVLYQSGVEIERKALSDLTGSITFTELDNATGYTVDIIADVDYDEATIRTAETLDSVPFTSPDVSPTISFASDTLEEHKIDLTTSVDDPYDTISTITGSAFTVEVYDETDTLLRTFDDVTDGTEISLSGLLADHTYTFRYIADTDYQDGDGIVNRMLHETTVTTDAYTTPDASVTLNDVTVDQVEFNATLSDPDGRGSITAIDLYKDGAIIDSIADLSTTPYVFDGLLADNGYEIVVTFDYDMLDGNGTQTGTTTETFTTDAYAEPVVSITSVTPSEDDVSFNVTESDPDTLNTIDSIELISGGTTVDTIGSPGTGSHTFTGLYSNHEYTIRLTHSYDLQDGEGVRTEIVETSFTTDALSEPTASLQDETVSGDTLSVDVSALSDTDNTVSTMTLELYEDGALVETIESVNASTIYTFSSTISNDTEYTVKLKADYDLNEEGGPQTGVTLDETKIVILS